MVYSKETVLIVLALFQTLQSSSLATSKLQSKLLNTVGLTYLFYCWLTDMTFLFLSVILVLLSSAQPIILKLVINY